jgi:hypothetical protein
LALALLWAGLPARAFSDAPEIAHYSSDDRQAAFTLDQSQAHPRLKFDETEEIFALTWRPAAGGDRILVRDDGSTILRVSVTGGVTLYSERYPVGVAVNFDRRATPLEGPPPPIETIRDSALEAAAQAAQVFGAPIRFEGDWARATEDAGLRATLYDCVRNARAALMQLAQDAGDRGRVSKSLRIVRFQQGAAPGAAISRNVLVVTYVMNDSVTGRPSSFRIASVVRAQLR